VNVLACLVHESPDCVVDLVRNLSYLDPDSLILLYNGGEQADLLSGLALSRFNAVVHPAPRRLRWGHLHDFAVDSMRWALAQRPFTTMTIVDSDQLALRAGYSDALAKLVAPRPRVGMLGSTRPAELVTYSAPLQAARLERELWTPFLKQFRDGEEKFPQWTFWPSTVFTADACRALLSLWDESALLRETMVRSKIWATEEVVLPTLVALLGFESDMSPFRSSYVKGRTKYSLPQVERALSTPDAYWIHPVRRRLNHPVRRHIRERLHHYGNGPLTRIDDR